MSNYIPLQLKTHYSLLQSTIKPVELEQYCKENTIPAVAITDYGLGAAVDAVKAFKDSPTKLIIGTNIYLQEKEVGGYVTLISKNLAGWKTLMKICSASNKQETWIGRPHLTLEQLATYDCGDLICITGGIGSFAANLIIQDKLVAYNSDNYDVVKGQIDEKTNLSIFFLQTVFGEDFYLESQIQDYQKRPIQRALTEKWRKFGCKVVASPDAHYVQTEDCYDQRVLLCSKTGYNFQNINDNIIKYEDHTFGRFFLSDKYNVLTDLLYHRPEELKLTFEVAEKCEKYNILSEPKLPKISCPDGMTDVQYLRQLCREGWKKRIGSKIPKSEHDVYAERVKYELSVIEEKTFSSYFLILSDLLGWVRSQGQLPGPGRGSAAGCLVSYLSQITAVNPIPHELLFERFMNPGRKSMPDIDIDVPSAFRPKVFEYIKNKYGEDNVAQITAYQNLKGRSALKTVLNAYGNISFGQMNDMTKHIPDEAAISDDLQEMKEEEGESSIIKWALENNPKKFSDWCELKPDGSLDGPMATRFEQAIRLEGTKQSQSKHPAGVVVTPGRFDDYCPLIRDKHGDLLAGFDMNAIEALGLVKLDVLATRVLDKIQATCNSLAE